jgi:CMP-N,N'-diacetyllegionaminic acid synthase
MKGQQGEFRVIAIIPARGGSKGLPRKNVRDLARKPLIAWTIEAAFDAGLKGNVYVSTDDDEIAHVASLYGAKVIKRPPVLAMDDSPSEDALIHAVKYLLENGEQIDAVVFLQATSPIRADGDIDRAINLFLDSNADSLLSVSPSHVLLWEETPDGPAPINYDYCHRPRRQAMKSQFKENGSIYIFKPSILLEGKNRLGGRIVLFKMKEESGLDIDNEADFAQANICLEYDKVRN